MKHTHSKIGEYGIRWKSVESHKGKNGKIIPPRMEKEEFKWKKYRVGN